MNWSQPTPLRRPDLTYRGRADLTFFSCLDHGLIPTCSGQDRADLTFFHYLNNKLWWNLHAKTNLWSRFMNQKICRKRWLYSTHIWLPKLELCSIHEFCETKCKRGVNLIWNISEHGNFGLKMAYEDCRPSKPSTIPYIHLAKKSEGIDQTLPTEALSWSSADLG